MRRLSDMVEVVPQHSWEVQWQGPIGLLFIDGLHDYTNVARDFHHFLPWLASGAYVAFHDYADYYPGVKAFVHELLARGDFESVQCVRSLMLLRRVAGGTAPGGRADACVAPSGMTLKSAPASR